MTQRLMFIDSSDSVTVKELDIGIEGGELDIYKSTTWGENSDATMEVTTKCMMDGHTSFTGGVSWGGKHHSYGMGETHIFDMEHYFNLYDISMGDVTLTLHGTPYVGKLFVFKMNETILNDGNLFIVPTNGTPFTLKKKDDFVEYCFRGGSIWDVMFAQLN